MVEEHKDDSDGRWCLMVMFCIRVTDTPQVREFLSKTNGNLLKEDAVRNPFTGGVEIVHKDHNSLQNNLYAIILMKPIYPNISYFGWFIALVSFMLFGGSWWLLIPILFGMTGIMFTKYPYYLGISKGLKKAGYDGKVTLIPLEQITEKIHFE